VTVQARPVCSRHPGNAYTGADGKIIGGSGYHFADDLVSRDYSRAARWQVTLYDVQISSAYSTRPHPHKNLTWLWFRPCDLANMKRLLQNFLG
jgi:hypothetical protein